MPDHSEYETGARHPVELKKRQDGTSPTAKGQTSVTPSGKERRGKERQNDGSAAQPIAVRFH
jgi:hypothetical protein